MRPDVYGDNNVANVKNEKSESGIAQSAARIFAIIQENISCLILRMR